MGELLKMLIILLGCAGFGVLSGDSFYHERRLAGASFALSGVVLACSSWWLL